MNGTQQKRHGQSIANVHRRIDTLAACVDLEVAEKMTEIRKVATTLNSETRAQAEMMDQDIRIELERQIAALATRVAAFENMTIGQAVRWLFARKWSKPNA